MRRAAAAFDSVAAAVLSDGSALTDSAEIPPKTSVDDEDARWNTDGRSGHRSDPGTAQRPANKRADSRQYHGRRGKEPTGPRGLERRAR